MLRHKKAASVLLILSLIWGTFPAAVSAYAAYGLSAAGTDTDLYIYNVLDSETQSVTQEQLGTEETVQTQDGSSGLASDAVTGSSGVASDAVIDSSGAAAARAETSKKKKKKKKKKQKYLRGYSHYKKPNGRIAECSSNEKGGVTGGRRGDQTRRELGTKRYSYNRGISYRNWKFVIRARDPRVANAAASFVTAACSNNRIGYDNYKNNQKGINKRDSLYKTAKKYDFKANRIRKRVDTSCTPLCMFGFCAAGVDMDVSLRARYTQFGKRYRGKYKARTVNAESLKRAIKAVNRKYRKRGKKPPFRIIKMSPKQFTRYRKYLRRGDVLCTGHHTVMVL